LTKEKITLLLQKFWRISMTQYFKVSKAIVVASLSLSFFGMSSAYAQKHSESESLNAIQTQAYNKMITIDNPNGADVADLHHVIFSKNEAQLHDYLVHAVYDKEVNSTSYQQSNPNAQDLADTMGTLSKYSDEKLINTL
jgi:hypothetical protein